MNRNYTIFLGSPEPGETFEWVAVINDQDDRPFARIAGPSAYDVLIEAAKRVDAATVAVA